MNDQHPSTSADDLFDELAALPPEQRRARLDRLDGRLDRQTRIELESLLAAHDDAGQFLLDTPRSQPPSPLDPHAPGTRVGPYELIELIGEGGFARVFRARQTQPLRREVAVKILKLGMDSSAVIARFELERQALAMMSHPHIAAVFDAGATDTGRPFFAMELVSGGQRVTRFCDENQLGVAARIRLFIDVCLAVQHAHEKGVLHRDLKPGNILVTNIDGRPTPKIIDFGIAKAIRAQLPPDATASPPTLTHEQQLLGTPQYMSPEQARSGGADVDTRSDIYSLGAVLFELLAGRTPLDAPTGPSSAIEQLQRLTSDDELPRPSMRAGAAELRRALRGEIDWIVGKCLEKDRARRYESAAALAADLKAHLEHRAISAAPPTLHYRAQKFARRNAVPVVAAALIVASLLAGSIVSTVMAIRARRAERIAQQQQEETQAVNKFLTEEIIGAANPLIMKANREMTLREALENASRAVGGQFADRPNAEAAVRESVAWAFRSLNRLDLALPHAVRALELRQRQLGSDHPDTLQARGTYAGILNSMGRRDEAEAIYKDLVEAYPRIGLPNHKLAINAMENYAGLLATRGRLDEAEPLARRASEQARRALGENDSKTIAATSQYALVVKRLGRVDEAEAIWRDLHARSLRARGPDYPDTIALMSLRASALVELGRSAEAEPLYHDVLDRYRRVYGDAHPRTIDALNSYAVTIQSSGRFAESEPMLKQVLELRQQVNGDDHPLTLTALNSYGVTLTWLGRREEAEAFERRALEGRRRVLGEDHPHTLASLNDYADVLTSLDRHAEAEAVAAELYRKATTAPIPPRLAASYIALYGPCLVKLGRYTEAEPPLREARRRLAETNQSTIGRMRRVIASLAEVADHAGRTEEAARWRAELDTLRATTAPATRPTTLSVEVSGDR